MHTCPICGQVCDCDLDDTWYDDVEICNHVCEDEDVLSEDDYIYDDDGWVEGLEGLYEGYD